MIAELFAPWSVPSFAPFITELIAPLGRVLLEFVWQGTAIGLSAWLLLAALRDARPQARYAVACFALLACLFAPLSSLWQLRGEHSDGLLVTTAAATTNTESTTSTMPVDRIWSNIASDWSLSIESGLPWIVALWLLGVVLMLLRAAAGVLWVQRVRECATLAIGDDLQRRFDALVARMRVGRSVRLRAIASGVDAIDSPIVSPMAAGVLAPIVILPTALLARMPIDLLEALIAHELAHVRRHDYLVNLLQTIVEALLFYHPVVWWLSRRIRHERELVADDIAVQALDAPRRLAVALAELDRLRAEYDDAAHDIAGFPVMLSQAAHGGQLMSRIQRLVKPKRPALGNALVVPLFGLAAIGLACYAYAQSDYSKSLSKQSLIANASSSNSALAQGSSRALPSPHISAEQAQAGVSGLTVTGKLDTDMSHRKEHEGYALVRHGQERFSISGDLDDIDRIKAAKSRIDGDFLWFSRDGKDYVVRDPATVARVNSAWRASAANEAKLQALSAEMESKSQAVQDLAHRVSAQHMQRAQDQAQTYARIAEIREIVAAKNLGERQAQIAQQQLRLEAQLDAELENSRGRNHRKIEDEIAALEAESEKVEAEMQAIEAEMEAKGAEVEGRVEADMAKMESDLEAKLEAATEPLETLGNQMEALSEQQQRIMADVDREIMREIDRALRENLAEPAPSDSEQ
jgi:beta-lactamase regulating signal transducer with metallopeptidase domain